MKIPQNKIKQKLKDYYKYFESDFYTDGENIYMNCQDNVGINVRDIFETLEQERKEVTPNFWSDEALDNLNYIIGADPYEQDNESSSYGAVYKVKPSRTIELVKYGE